MTISVVQSHETQNNTAVASLTATFSGVVAGNALILFATSGSSSYKSIDTPSGWTTRQSVFGGHSILFATKVATGSETTVIVTYRDAGMASANVDIATLVIAEIHGVYGSSATTTIYAAGSAENVIGITPGAGIEALMLLGILANNAYNVTAYPSGYSVVEEETADIGYSHRLSVLARVDNPTVSGAYGGAIFYDGATSNWASVHAYFTAVPTGSADFTVDDNAGPAPFPVQFTDLSSGGTITAWAWDFGDDGTSTSQNPAHTYVGSGTYTVSLTVTIGGIDYTETKIAYIVVSDNTAVDPPPPAGAIVEIYVTEAGGYRWDEATWDDAIFSTSEWTNVTPQSIDAQIRWGSSRPELGILSQPEAESWALDIYDPDRVLDPANASGPYYGDLRPGLPIRINHSIGHFGGTTIRTGIVESMGHEFLEPHLSDFGYIRATNDQATYANAAVPHDTTLSDTLWARTQDAMEAAGLPVRLLTVPDTDPPLVAWSDTGTDQSVWDWISDAAQSVLWVPYFDNHGWLGFREYANPISRSIQLAAPELIHLKSIIEYNGNYSRVIVHDDADVEVIRHVSTEYGTRTFTRTNLTPNADDWADAVIGDRAFHSLRWIPGDMYPLSGASVLRLARVTAVELASVSNLYTDPVVNADAIIVGGEINITARAALVADWRFVYNMTQALSLPLVEDGSSPPEYLTLDGGSSTEYLFPD